MPAWPSLLHETYVFMAAEGAMYTGTITLTALTSILARDPVLRQDARETLKILLPRRRRHH